MSKLLGHQKDKWGGEYDIKYRGIYSLINKGISTRLRFIFPVACYASLYFSYDLLKLQHSLYIQVSKSQQFDLAICIFGNLSRDPAHFDLFQAVLVKAYKCFAIARITSLQQP